MAEFPTFKGSWPWPLLHTVMHHSSTSTYIPNFIDVEETFCGRTDGRTDRHLRPTVLGRLRIVDLKTGSNYWPMTRPNPVTWFNSDVRCTWQSLQTKLIHDFTVASFSVNWPYSAKNMHQHKIPWNPRLSVNLSAFSLVSFAKAFRL